MKKILIILLSITSLYPIFSQEELVESKIVFENIEFDPFFAAVVTDNEGEIFNITRAAFYDEYNDKKFFFWVRRNSGLYTMSFKNIKAITFSDEDFSDNRYVGFTKGSLELVTGEVYEIYLKTTGNLQGMDTEFNSPVTFYLNYNLIRSIQFLHSGEYQICPFCGNIYFDSEIDTCIYDKTPLIKGVLEISEK